MLKKTLVTMATAIAINSFANALSVPLGIEIILDITVGITTDWLLKPQS